MIWDALGAFFDFAKEVFKYLFPPAEEKKERKKQTAKENWDAYFEEERRIREGRNSDTSH